MQTDRELEGVAHRRPTPLDLAAAALLVATVVLHVVAMVPTYYLRTGSLWSQTDQAALYAVLAAAWALSLAIGLTGPHRTPVAAALAVGVGAAELGFRVADLGIVFRYGTSDVGAGLWLMEAAWVAGAAAAAVAVLAAVSRHRRAVEPAEDTPAVAGGDWTVPLDQGSNPYGGVGAEGEAPPEPVLAPLAPATDGGALQPIPDGDEDPQERLAWTALVVVLAAVVAGAFLPAWDHAVATSTVTGQTVTRSLGNAFTGPWQQVVGTVLAAVALLAVPVVAIRQRNKAVGAAAVSGALLVLASQLVSAVVQVGEPVPPAYFGITPAQARQLGLQLSLKLTSWFTVDALAAYALFAAVMVWATLRVVHPASARTVADPPSRPSEAVPWAS